jgi:hypothetical protein
MGKAALPAMPELEMMQTRSFDHRPVAVGTLKKI